MTVLPLRTAKVCFHLATIAGALLIWSGCSQSSDADLEPSGEIRGEAISPPSGGATIPEPPGGGATASRPPGDGDTASESAGGGDTALRTEGSENTGSAAAEPPASPASALPETSTAAKKQEPEKIGEYTVVGFDELAGFEFDVTDDLMSPPEGKLEEAQEKTAGQIPPSIKAFDKTSVALQGYMLPLKVEGGLVTELLIMRDQSMCCYGTVPKINEWVSVKMVAKGVKPIMDQPVMIFGKLKVGEMRENGYLVGIYELDGDKMSGPLDM